MELAQQAEKSSAWLWELLSVNLGFLHTELVLNLKLKQYPGWVILVDTSRAQAAAALSARQ